MAALFHGGHRVSDEPEGWFEPWICEWQFMQLRPNALCGRHSRSAGLTRRQRHTRVPGFRVTLLTEERLPLSEEPGWLLPCGSWQIEQSSVTGACSQRKGPRFSAWQVKHVSLSVRPTSAKSAMEPCGLWQSLQASAILAQRVRIDLLELAALGDVARVADIGLRGPGQHGVFHLVAVVAGGARDAVHVMRTHVPVRDGRLFVTTQAHRVLPR